MSEFVFPITMTLIVYAVLVPALTLASRALLELMGRTGSHPHEEGRWSVFVLIVAPLVIPTAGILGASLHRLDGHHAYEVCVALHRTASSCHEVVWLAVLIGLPLLFSLVRKFRRSIRRGVRVPELEFSDIEVRMVEGWEVCTRGLWRPWIEVGSRALDELSGEQLRAAMLHEVQHARARDPLATMVCRAALSVNPVGILLEPWFARWSLGREIRCDLQAVAEGGDRFALAESLLKVARSNSTVHRCGAVGLTGAAATLRLRVNVLIGRDLPFVRADHLIMLLVLTATTVAAIVGGYVEMPYFDLIHHRSENYFISLSRP